MGPCIYPRPQDPLVRLSDNERVAMAKENQNLTNGAEGSPEIESYPNNEVICGDGDRAGQWEKDGATSNWMSKWRKKLILTLTSHRTQKSIPDGLQIYM